MNSTTESKSCREQHVFLSTHAWPTWSALLGIRLDDSSFLGGRKTTWPQRRTAGSASAHACRHRRPAKRDLLRRLASLQFDTGISLEVFQKKVGHDSKTTTEIYARLALDPVRALVERATENILSAKGD